jgi:hypothetical protein
MNLHESWLTHTVLAAKYEKAKSIDPDQILEEAKKEEPDHSYVVAFARLSWILKDVVRDFGHAMKADSELDALRWAAEKMLGNDRSDLRSFECLYNGASVVKDLRKRGWSDTQIREHHITDLEVTKERHLTADDFCLNCADPEDFVGSGEIFCSLCEDQLVEIPSAS